MARTRKVNLARVRSRLYAITQDGDDRVAVQAARVLLQEDAASSESSGADPELIAVLRDAFGETPEK